MSRLTHNDIINNARDRLRPYSTCPSETSQRFIESVIYEANKHTLPRNEMVALLRYLGIDPIDVPSKYRDWDLGISPCLQSVKYTNPKNSLDYLLQIRSKNKFETFNVAHHPIDGFLPQVDVFQNLVPYINCDLGDIVTQYSSNMDSFLNGAGRLTSDKICLGKQAIFTDKVSKPINQKNQEALDPYAIRLIQALLEIAVPTIDGICPRCFKVSFPKNGPGIRYKTLGGLPSCEIRLSPAKEGGKDMQKDIFITNITNVNGEKPYLTWIPLEAPTFTFSKNVIHERGKTHIPYFNYDQNEAENFLRSRQAREYFEERSPNAKDLRIPVCQCKK